MLRKLNNKRKLQKGFTIIEVMIVLAIAGLILVVVLLAIPQLQRNQRNEARRSAAARIVAEINNFGGNNNGKYPIASTSTGAINFGNPKDGTTFMGRYLGCSTTATSVDALCTANINDPRTGFPMGSGELGRVVGSPEVETAVGGNGSALGTDSGDLYYTTGAICSGEATTSTGATSRNFAFIARLEGGAAYCLDNR